MAQNQGIPPGPSWDTQTPTQTSMNWRDKTAGHQPGHFWYWAHLGDTRNAKVLPVKPEGIKSICWAALRKHSPKLWSSHVLQRTAIHVQTSATTTLTTKPEDWSVGDTYNNYVLSNVDPSTKLKISQCLSPTTPFSIFILHGLCRQSML